MTGILASIVSAVVAAIVFGIINCVLAIFNSSENEQLVKSIYCGNRIAAIHIGVILFFITNLCLQKSAYISGAVGLAAFLSVKFLMFLSDKITKAKNKSENDREIFELIKFVIVNIVLGVSTAVLLHGILFSKYPLKDIFTDEHIINALVFTGVTIGSTIVFILFSSKLRREIDFQEIDGIMYRVKVFNPSRALMNSGIIALIVFTLYLSNCTYLTTIQSIAVGIVIVLMMQFTVRNFAVSCYVCGILLTIYLHSMQIL